MQPHYADLPWLSSAQNKGGGVRATASLAPWASSHAPFTCPHPTPVHTSLSQALPAVEYSRDIHQWRATQMAPDLAMLVLIAAYTALVIYDTVSTWSIERKSRRRQATAAAVNGGSAGPVTSFRTRTSLFMMVFELCLCGLMMGAVATWYIYATSLVQNDTFSTRCVCQCLGGAVKGGGMGDLLPAALTD